ncbi:unnamed protein product [Miscanthus lutarioriparius]|uniref:Uncharacterized protein n=1 Tax=Miscanthus lutarioriparius TaxID=422564 RepID=A0A811MV97_9POAL|nr:unnamed protein product [Miscanthus lutarioriparius]
MWSARAPAHALPRYRRRMLRQNSKVVAGSHEVVVEERCKLVTSETQCGECGVAATATTSPADMGKDEPPEEVTKAKNLASVLQSFASVFADVTDMVLMVLASSCILEGVEAILQDIGAPRWTHAPQRTATEQKRTSWRWSVGTWTMAMTRWAHRHGEAPQEATRGDSNGDENDPSLNSSPDGVVLAVPIATATEETEPANPTEATATEKKSRKECLQRLQNGIEVQYDSANREHQVDSRSAEPPPAPQPSQEERHSGFWKLPSHPVAVPNRRGSSARSAASQAGVVSGPAARPALGHMIALNPEIVLPSWKQMENGSGAVVPSNSSDRSDRSDKPLDQKTMRRLAQNREAARKSRLRKKAYVQQLESSKLKLAQLEQELQKARQQGIFISSSGDQTHAMSGNGALTFDIEYARWLEDQNKQINELRTAVNAHASDSDLRLIVDGIMAHYDEIFKVKGVAAKADVFHILSGMWKTPAERCFLWLGGFRPSELLKLLANHLEPLTEQQMLGLNNLQQSSQQAEDALSQGMEALQQSLAETLAGSLGPSGSSGNVANYMGQMAMAMGKLGTLENFLRQADNLRQQTLHQMQRILTIRQASRALLAVHDYFSRLRALSSLWLARPRE